MRHPIDRLISQYIHEWTLNVISVEINQAITQHPELIEYSRYSKQIEPYLEIFGQERILPVFFERFLNYRSEELARICRFIGYQGQPVWKNELDAQNVSSERMRQNLLRDFLVEVPILREIRQQLIPKSWRTWVRNLWTMNKKPEIEPHHLNYLQAIFNEDLAILGSWLGIELSCNNFKARVQDNSIDWKIDKLII